MLACAPFLRACVQPAPRALLLQQSADAARVCYEPVARQPPSLPQLSVVQTLLFSISLAPEYCVHVLHQQVAHVLSCVRR
jgi:hypothetical protein